MNIWHHTEKASKITTKASSCVLLYATQEFPHTTTATGYNRIGSCVYAACECCTATRFRWRTNMDGAQIVHKTMPSHIQCEAGSLCWICFVHIKHNKRNEAVADSKIIRHHRVATQPNQRKRQLTEFYASDIFRKTVCHQNSFDTDRVC